MLGKLNLSSLDGVMTGSESGSVVIPGKPESSKLYNLVHDGVMPLDRKTQVSPELLGIIRLWIEKSPEIKDAKPRVAKLTQYDVIPIMMRHCTPCHGIISRKDAGLDLRTRASMLQGGKSGPALVPGSPEKSLLFQKIVSGEMPPVPKGYTHGSLLPFDEHLRLDDSELKTLKLWIEQGAPEGDVQPDVASTQPDPLVSDEARKFWSFQPPKAAATPAVQHEQLVRNPIDAFVLSKLEKNGLSLSPEADRLTLIRRATMDLTGLPPTPQEVKTFLADRDPHAYGNLIDRLLASPRYGERWGRYWLDLAGYADVDNKDSFKRAEAWRYRDYVIRAFNADKPFDRFLLEQIAGDELADYEHAPVMTQQLMDNLIATGFMRMTPDASYNSDEVPQDRWFIINDEMQVLGQAILGLTIHCAECHNHKLEPIPQRDYYRLKAVFQGAMDEWDWMQSLGKPDDPGVVTLPVRDLPYITPQADHQTLEQQEQERKERNQKLDDQISSRQSALNAKAKPLKEKLLDQELAKLPSELQADLRQMLATPPDKRNAAQKQLAAKYEPALKIDPEKLKEDADYKRAADETEDQILVLESQKNPEPYIRALWDRGEPSPTYIYIRGDYTSFGQLVGPGVPSVLTDGKTPFVTTPPWPGAHKTGRRLAFARWLVSPDNPLTARVWVNRIWQHHFDKGIVATPANLGTSGAPPSNQELLDWLAVRFEQDGWSVKAMQRLIMTSSTYRQSSKVTPLEEKLDPENELLSRMPMIRMDAESLRDSLLFVAGRLDETRSGPPVLLRVHDDGLVTEPETPKGQRRSIYLEQRRQHVLTVLDTFDYPMMIGNSMAPDCPERVNTAVAPQALYLMNDTMIRKLADDLANRVRSEAGSNLADQIDRVYWIALSRPPAPQEKTFILKELNSAIQAQPDKAAAAKQAVDRLSLAIINSNNFMFIN